MRRDVCVQRGVREIVGREILGCFPVRFVQFQPFGNCSSISQILHLRLLVLKYGIQRGTAHGQKSPAMIKLLLRAYEWGCTLAALDSKFFTWYENKRGFLELDMILVEGMDEC